jgi:hypothetical protein
MLHYFAREMSTLAQALQKRIQYHNAVNDACYLILFREYPTQTIKKARYHDAVYDKCYFILLWKISHKWPKKDRYHDAVNHTCDNTSLVKCLQTFAPIKVQSHNAVNDTRYLILFWEYPTQTFKKSSVP